jgi:hypothetical protein
MNNLNTVLMLQYFLLKYIFFTIYTFIYDLLTDSVSSLVFIG